MLSINRTTSEVRKDVNRDDVSAGHICFDNTKAPSLPGHMHYCGACSETFSTICQLHDHLQGQHMSNGCYHYNSALRTAFPKYDSVCCFTQTVTEDDDEDTGVDSFVPLQNEDSLVPLQNDNKHCDKLSNKIVRKKRTRVDDHVKPVVNSEKKGDKVENEKQEPKIGDGKWSAQNFLPLTNEAQINGLKDVLVAPKAKKSKLGNKVTGSKSQEKVNANDLSQEMPADNLDSSRLKKTRSNSRKVKEKMSSVIILPSKPVKSNVNMPNGKKVVKLTKGKKRKTIIRKSQRTKNAEESKSSEIQANTLEMKNIDILSVISLKCQYCLEVFEKENELMEHINQKHSKNESFFCSTCKCMFTSQLDLDQHNSTFHQKYSTTCTTIATDDLAERKKHGIVSNKGVKKSTINKKKEVEDKSPYTCDVCCLVMPRSKKEAHSRLHSGERPYVCEQCGKGLISQNKLKRHMLIHSEVKKHTCDVCGAGFQMKYKLRMHMHIHTGKKPYLCSICGAEFNHSSNLATHTRCVHLQIKPFECKVCGGTYAKRSQLDDHVMSHSSERQFTCRYCGKSFKYLKGMKRHEKNHTDDKSLHCNKCDAQFTCASDLKDHISTAHTSRTMKCAECKKMFWDGIAYEEHKATQCDSKKYQCAICGEYYKVCNRYYTHMLAAHGIERQQAKAFHNQNKVIKDITSYGNSPVTSINNNLNLHTAVPNIEQVSSLDSVQVTNSISNPSFSVRQMVTGLLEGNQSNISTISALTRAATENLRLHSQDIADEEKLSAILTPLNPLVALDRSQDLNSFIQSDTSLINPSRSNVSSMQMDGTLLLQTDNPTLSDGTRDGLLLPNRTATRIGLISMNDMLGMNQDGGGLVGRLGDRYQSLNGVSLAPVSSGMSIDQAALLEHESNMALRRLAQNSENQEVPAMIIAGSTSGLGPLDGNRRGNQSEAQSVTIGYQGQNLY